MNYRDKHILGSYGNESPHGHQSGSEVVPNLAHAVVTLCGIQGRLPQSVYLGTEGSREEMARLVLFGDINGCAGGCLEMACKLACLIRLRCWTKHGHGKFCCRRERRQLSKIHVLLQHIKSKKPLKRLVWSKKTLPRSRQNRNNVSHKKVTSHLRQRLRRKNFQDKAIEAMRGRAPHLF